MIKIFTDSDGDMPRDFYERYDIGVVPFGISYGDETYYSDYYGVTPLEFYRRCRETNAFPKTSQPNSSQYEEKLRPALREGADVICLCITGKFSGSVQSGIMAMNSLKEEFPDRRIAVIDSYRCTIIHGYLVYQAVLMREEGKSFDEIVSTLEELRDKQFTFATVDSLEYLRKGGRLGKAGALAGSLLNIKPIIMFTDGELQAHSKVRGKKNAIAEIIRSIVRSAGDYKDQYVPIVFSCDMPEETKLLAKELEQNGFGPIVHKWVIGPVVGTHLGPTGFAVSLLKKYEGQTKL